MKEHFTVCVSKIDDDRSTVSSSSPPLLLFSTLFQLLGSKKIVFSRKKFCFFLPSSLVQVQTCSLLVFAGLFAQSVIAFSFLLSFFLAFSLLSHFDILSPPTTVPKTFSLLLADVVVVQEK